MLCLTTAYVMMIRLCNVCSSAVEEAHTLPAADPGRVAVSPCPGPPPRRICAGRTCPAADAPGLPARPVGPRCAVKALPRASSRACVGPIRWRRRVGRCPQGCAIPQVAPFDDGPGGAAASADQWGAAVRWAVPWRSLCRLPRRRGCWAGTVAAWSAPARCGVGCKRLATRPWSTSRTTWPPWRRGTSRRPSRWRPSRRPCRWPWGPMA